MDTRLVIIIGYINFQINMNTTAILLAVGVFLAVILLLVAILLIAKRYLVSSINGDKVYDVAAGGSLLNQLGEAGVHLPSACGGKGSCGQCKCQVLSGGGEILPTETVHFSRKQQKEGWRLGCQVKVKEDITMKVDEERRYLHQRVQGAAASGRAHALRAGFVRTDHHPRVRHRLRPRHG